MLKSFRHRIGPISWSTEQDCVDTVLAMQVFQIVGLLYIVQCNLNCTTQTVAPLIEVLLTAKRLHGQHLIDRIAGCYLVVLPACCSSHLVHTAASSDRYFAAKPTILVMTHIYIQADTKTYRELCQAVVLQKEFFNTAKAA